jgi:hypothetical protein
LSPGGTSLAGVNALAEPLGDVPSDALFPFQLLEFNVIGISPGSAVIIDLILPEGVNIDFFFNYGTTPGNTTAHWYEFTFDGTTGVEISGNRVTLHFVDGARGDDDATANGRVSERGGPGVENASNVRNWRLY